MEDKPAYFSYKFYYNRKRNVRRKVLQDSAENDGVDEGEDTAMDVGDEADSQVSHELRGQNVYCTCTFIKAASSTQVLSTYRALAKEGPWAVHLTLGQDWGMGRYSRYQYRIYTQKSTQVSYPCYLHNSNSSSGYY